MKCYFVKFFLWQIWVVMAYCLFFDNSLASFFLVFFLIVDLICLIAFAVRKGSGEKVEASIKSAFDIIPYKWFGIAGLLGAISVMHWNEHFELCLFLWITLLLGYVFDAIDRYKTWKKR